MQWCQNSKCIETCYQTAIGEVIQVCTLVTNLIMFCVATGEGMQDLVAIV